MRNPDQSPTDHVLFNVACGSPTDKAVLVCMARRADWWGENSKMAVDTIARMTELSRRTVQDAKRRLESGGFIEQTGTTSKRTVVYRILGMQESDSEPAQEGATVQEPHPDRAAPAPEVEPSEGVVGGRKENYVLPKKTPAERVWAYYVQVFGKLPRPLPDDERAIIRQALKAVDGREEDLTLAIDGNKASAFHQGDNEGRKKYNSLSHILKGKRAGAHGSGRTTLETIEMFMERAAEVARAGSSASDADISRAKRAVLDGLTYPGDEHVAKRGEEAVAWLASEVGIRWDETARKWVPA